MSYFTFDYEDLYMLTLWINTAGIDCLYRKDRCVCDVSARAQLVLQVQHFISHTTRKQQQAVPTRITPVFLQVWLPNNQMHQQANMLSLLLKLWCEVTLLHISLKFEEAVLHRQKNKTICSVHLYTTSGCEPMNAPWNEIVHALRCLCVYVRVRVRALSFQVCSNLCPSCAKFLFTSVIVSTALLNLFISSSLFSFLFLPLFFFEYWNPGNRRMKNNSWTWSVLCVFRHVLGYTLVPGTMTPFCSEFMCSIWQDKETYCGVCKKKKSDTESKVSAQTHLDVHTHSLSK